ncbi:MAG: hypothetical protein O7G85_08335, partial [Planctomycetota bacterium]|nr:hypothetical protein [Planctomycetota bacterium]
MAKNTDQLRKVYEKRLTDLSKMIGQAEKAIPKLKDAGADQIGKFTTSTILKVRDKLKDAKDKLKGIEKDPNVDPKKILKEISGYEKRVEAIEKKLDELKKASGGDDQFDPRRARDYFTEKFRQDHVRNPEAAKKAAIDAWNSRVSLGKNFGKIEQAIQKAITAAEAVKTDE